MYHARSVTLINVLFKKCNLIIIKCSGKQMAESKLACKSYCDKVVTSLREIFDPTGNSDILASESTMLDPSVISKVHEHRNIVESHLNTILPYANSIGLTSLRTQSINFMEFMNSNTTIMKLMNSTVNICQYLMKNNTVYPEMANLAFRLCTVPVSFVDCERGLSRHNLIRTKTRNSLGTRGLRG